MIKPYLRSNSSDSGVCLHCFLHTTRLLLYDQYVLDWLDNNGYFSSVTKILKGSEQYY